MPSYRLTATVFVYICMLGAPSGHAGDDVGASPSQPVDVALTERDLDEIKTIMVQNAPVLASSPGIKHTSAYRHDGAIQANVIFYPHEVIGGIGRAVNASCEKPAPEAPWTCPSGNLRLYVQIPGQAFQVRVIGNIHYEVALALIDATGEALRAHPDFAGDAPDTAVMIVSTSEHLIMVGWGDSAGYSKVNVEAALIEGGDPRASRSWRVLRVADKPVDDPRHGTTRS